MELEPVRGRPVRVPPGRVEVRLDWRYRRAYGLLYAGYQSYLAGLPVLRERDFDGRAVRITPAELDALNRGLAAITGDGSGAGPNPFAGQEGEKTRVSRRLQFLS